MAGLTTHILDTARGGPANDVEVTLFGSTDDGRVKIKTVRTNTDGRCDEPLLQASEMQQGYYELEFHIEPYFKRTNPVKADELPFLDRVSIRFAVAHPEEHYHIPLLVSPFAYSTYRGS